MKRIVFMVIIPLFILIIIMNAGVYAYAADTDDNYGKEVESRADEKADTAVDNISGFTKNEYDKAVEGSSHISSDLGKRLTVRILKAFYRFYEAIKSMAGIMISVSVFIGILLIVLCKKNKQRRRLGLFFFIIGFPLLVLLIVYGIGILNGIYLREAGVVFETSREYSNLLSIYGQFMPVTKEGIFVSSLNSINRLHKGITLMSPIIILIFETLGLLRVRLCKFDKRRKDIGLYGYCIGIPLAILFVVVGAKCLNGAFV